jgi:eukaryotic-like serine/threonine-protein kinase
MDAPKKKSPEQVSGGPGAAVRDSSSSGTSAGINRAARAVTAAGAALAPSRASAILQPGMLLAGRYRILQMLGAGGMGEVYKVHDDDIDQVIALKVVRSDLSSDAESVQRFKQELLLTRQVSHRNVVRIFDIGETSGLKFITMEYIEGQTLSGILAEKNKVPPAEALEIVRQICSGLAAAHAEGVIHRDLKPSNIMRDAHGRVVVMDFGLARTLQGAGMTQTGATPGTVEYMSPEQAMAKPLDARSDLFTVGLILYELLSGKAPFHADSAVASLLKRLKEAAPALSELEPAIPRALSAIVSKCLEREPQDRYQSVDQLREELDRLEGRQSTGSHARLSRMLASRLPGSQVLGTKRGAIGFGVMLAAALVIVSALTIAAYRYWIAHNTPTQHAPVSILVSDFQNTTSESVFDGTLESAFTLGMEGAPFISSYNSGTAHKLAAQLRPGATQIDGSLARLIATREGINIVIAGSIGREGDAYRVMVRALDGVTGKAIDTESAEADKKDVLVAMSKLAAGIRRALGDKTPESVQLTAAETYTTRSLDAAHEYALAQVGQFTGHYNDAIEHSLKALQFDPEMGRAYVVLAVVYNNMKQAQQARKYFELALSKIDRMSDREKYRTRGAYYLVAREPDKALEANQQLVNLYPADQAGAANLALAYFYRRDMARALQEGRRAVQIYPKNTIQRNNVGLYAMYAGDFDTAIQEQRAVREMNPSLVLAYVGAALPQLALGHPEQATVTYHEAEKLGPDGASAAAAGLADLALYQGRITEAMKILEAGITQDLNNKNPDGAANKLVTLSQAQDLTGNSQQALRTSERSLALSHDLPIQFWAARAYITAKQDTKAESIALELGRGLEADPQAYGKLIEGEVQLSRGEPQQALRLFLESRKFADTWMGRLDAGLAYVETGAFAEAESDLEVCLKRRGEATALFLDESPTYHLFPPVYYYLGRAQQGLKSPAAGDSYKTFLGMKQHSDHDPLVENAIRRVGSL